MLSGSMWGQGTWLRAMILWALLAQASDVRAQSALTLEWSAPAECPAATQARTEVSQLLTRAVSPARANPPEVRIAIERISTEQLRARIAVRATGELREQALTDSDCGALTHAAALVVAIAVAPATRSRALRGAAREPSPLEASALAAAESAGAHD